jgi:hypothetical protein
MKPWLISIAAVFLLSLTPANLIAKEVTIGIYAVIESVTVEPHGPAPTVVRISGMFVVPVPISSGDYQAPKRGYLILADSAGHGRGSPEGLGGAKEGGGNRARGWIWRVLGAGPE